MAEPIFDVDSLSMEFTQVSEHASDLTNLREEMEILRQELLEERRLRIYLEVQIAELLKGKKPNKKTASVSSASATEAVISAPLKGAHSTQIKKNNKQNVSAVPIVVTASAPAIPASNVSTGIVTLNTASAPATFLADKLTAPSTTRYPSNNRESSPAKKRLRPSTPPIVETEIKKANIPPIILNNPSDYKAARQTIINNGLSFSSIQRTDCAKIIAASTDDFRKITNLLDERKFSFHTYTLTEDKPLRVVIRGLNADFTCDEIKEELLSLKFEVESINQLKNKKSSKPMLLFAVSLKKSEHNKSIYNLGYLLHQRITVEQQNRPKGILQCHRCQLFGHSAINCRATPACVKCAGPHLTRDCSHEEKIDKPLCSNCAGSHPANYGGCAKNPNNKKNIDYKKPRDNKKTHNHINNKINGCSFAEKLKGNPEVTPINNVTTENPSNRDVIIKMFMELSEKMKFISSHLLPTL